MGCPKLRFQPCSAAACFERTLRAAEQLAADLSSVVVRPPLHAADSGYTPPVEREASQTADSLMIVDTQRLRED